MKLRNVLRKKDVQLFSRLSVIEERARELLEFSQGGAHISYSPHGLSHVSYVEDYYDVLLPDKTIREISSIEIFVLLVATLFHDSMMIPSRLGEEKKVRKEHATRALDFLSENSEILSLTKGEAFAIGKVIEGHAVDSISELGAPIPVGSHSINIQFLASCLSLADLCHADESRAPRIVFKHLVLDEESEYHWKRHMSISGISIQDNAIVIGAMVYDDLGKKSIEEYREMIEMQLKRVKPYFDSKIRKIDSQVKLELLKRDSPFDRELSFRADMPELVQMFVKSIYSREDTFLRELAQNAMDACTIKASKSAISKYTPKILISIIKNTDNTLYGIRIDDNGVGMNVVDIEETMLWIGRSIGKDKSISDEILKSHNKGLIASFGIGILTCFRVSEEIIIRSQKENSDAIELILNSISQTILPKKIDSDLSGTTVIVKIDVNKYSACIRDVIEAMWFHFRAIDSNLLQMKLFELGNDDWRARRGIIAIDTDFFPVCNINYRPDSLLELLTIWLEDDDVDKYNVLNEELLEYYDEADYRQKEIAFARLSSERALEEAISKILYFNKRIHSKGWIGEFWQLFFDNNSPHETIEMLESGAGEIELLQDGIFITRLKSDEILPRGFGHVYATIDIFPGFLDLTVSREDVIRNTKFKRFCEELANKSLVIFEAMLDAHNTTLNHAKMLSKNEQLDIVGSSAITISYCFNKAFGKGEARDESLLERLGNYSANVYKIGFRKLADIADDEDSDDIADVVFAFSINGYSVESLAEFNGKMLFHEDTDEKQMVASLLAINDYTVIDAIGVGDYRELDMIKRYFDYRKIRFVDIFSDNAHEFLAQEFEQIIDYGTTKVRKLNDTDNMLFIERDDLADKKAWSVGGKTYYNLSNPDVSKVFAYMLTHLSLLETPSLKARLAKICLLLLGYKFEDALEELLNEICRE